MRVGRVLGDAIWPTRPSEDEVNPPELFRLYAESLAKLESLPNGLVRDEELLAVVQRLFDETETRRQSIDSRAGNLLGATGVTSALVLGAAPLMRFRGGALHILLTTVAAVLLVAIYVYLVRAGLSALRAQGRATRFLLGPDDLVAPTVIQREVSFQRHLAVTQLRYLVQNYKANNRQLEALAVGQRSLRNGIILVLVVGSILIGLRV